MIMHRRNGNCDGAIAGAYSLPRQVSYLLPTRHVYRSTSLTSEFGYRFATFLSAPTWACLVVGHDLEHYT